ncbi:MAG: transposase-like protein [Bradymonadia bacterium]|jgi:transposase-like protein
MQYSEKFKSRMIVKHTAPNARSANSVSREVGISQATLSRWLRDAKVSPMTKKSKAKKSKRRWSPEDKVRVVMEAAALSGEELGAFLRREGLHDVDLERFRADVTEAASDGLRARNRRGATPEQREIQRLKKELARKDKALTETAALLVLRGKWDAFLAEGEEGGTPERND